MGRLCNVFCILKQSFDILTNDDKHKIVIKFNKIGHKIGLVLGLGDRLGDVQVGHSTI